jgi:hypothetical protein
MHEALKIKCDGSLFKFIAKAGQHTQLLRSSIPNRLLRCYKFKRSPYDKQLRKIVIL